GAFRTISPLSLTPSVNCSSGLVVTQPSGGTTVICDPCRSQPSVQCTLSLTVTALPTASASGAGWASSIVVACAVGVEVDIMNSDANALSLQRLHAHHDAVVVDIPNRHRRGRIVDPGPAGVPDRHRQHVL